MVGRLWIDVKISSCFIRRESCLYKVRTASVIQAWLLLVGTRDSQLKDSITLGGADSSPPFLPGGCRIRIGQKQVWEPILPLTFPETDFALLTRSSASSQRLSWAHVKIRPRSGKLSSFIYVDENLDHSDTPQMEDKTR